MKNAQPSQKRTAAADADADPSPDTEYGIHRLRREPAGRSSPVRRSSDGGYGWYVTLRRRTRTIQMAFWDTTYGGRDAALFVARAYRDAVAAVVPAMSRREKREQPRGEARRPEPAEIAAPARAVSSPSGATPPSDVPLDLPRVAGVNYQPPLKPGHAAYWVAQTEVSSRGSGKGRKRRAKYFNVTKLGHTEAHARAVAARRAMLDAMEGVDEPFLLDPEARRLHRAGAGAEEAGNASGEG